MRSDQTVSSVWGANAVKDIIKIYERECGHFKNMKA
jgi:hypothetical protein